MQLGRKIYFEKSTGKPILDIGERRGDVIETTLTEDIAAYDVLKTYTPDTVDYITLEQDTDKEKFGKYNYTIDTALKTIVWGALIPVTKPLTVDEIIDQQVQQKMGENYQVLQDALSLLQESGVV